jgi:hypothetical protein
MKCAAHHIVQTLARTFTPGLSRAADSAATRAATLSRFTGSSPSVGFRLNMLAWVTHTGGDGVAALLGQPKKGLDDVMHRVDSSFRG